MSAKKRAPDAADEGGGRQAPSLALDTLPADLLPLILSHIPTHPLLATVARVSRRWRAAALRAVTSVRISSADRLPPFALFPSLTAVKVSHKFRGTLQLPPTVRRLDVSELPRPQEGNERRLTGPLPPLTHLTMRICNHPEELAALLPAVQDSLVSLRLGWASAAALESLVQSPLPSLTELHMPLPPPQPRLSASQHRLSLILLAAHASRLRSLTLTAASRGAAVWDFTALTPLAFPRLTSLRFANAACPADALQRMLSQCPSLQTLATVGSTDLAAAPPSSLAMLTRFNFDARLCALPPQFFASLPPLCRISCTLSPELLSEIPHLYSRLTLLYIEGGATHATFAALQQCTALKRLTITVADSELPPATLALPRLTTLRLKVKGYDTALAAVPRLLSAAPRLRTLNLDMWFSPEQVGAQPRLPVPISLLRELQHSGVQKLALLACGYDTLSGVRALEPLAAHTAESGGWLAVSLVIPEPTHVKLKSLREYREYRTEVESWEGPGS